MTLAVLCYEACRVAQFLNNNISEDDGCAALCSYGTRNSPSLLTHPLGEFHVPVTGFGLERGCRLVLRAGLAVSDLAHLVEVVYALLHFQAAGLKLLSLLTYTRPVCFGSVQSTFQYHVN